MLTETTAVLATGVAANAPLAAARDKPAQAGFGVDYVALVDGPSLTIPATAPGARLIATARLGSVRLLDNVPA